jgi:antitoxin component YwqK of YwqJK toxin-antitoxin module
MTKLPVCRTVVRRVRRFLFCRKTRRPNGQVVSLRSGVNAPPPATRRRASLYIGGVWIRKPKELNMKRLLGLLLVMGMVGCGQNENAGNAVDPGIGADEQLVTDSGGEKNAPSNPNVKVDEPPVQTGDAPPAGEAALPATPNKPQAKVDEPPVQTVDASESELVLKGGLMYEGDSETPLTGVVVTKHDNGQKSVEMSYKDGKLEGLMTMWHENGQKRSEETYKDGKLEGLKTMWHKNGQKSSAGTYKDGKREGLGTGWLENGQKWIEETYKDGKLGLVTGWHKNGQKKSEATYKDGKKVSETKWDKEGNEIK